MKIFINILCINMLFVSILCGDLLRDEATAESLFDQLIEKNGELLNEIYNKCPSTEGGRVLNVDLARMFFAPYNDGNLGGYRYSAATHKGSGKFIESRLYRMMEALAAEDDKGEVLFLAGGSGSGKGSVKTLLPEVYESADLVYDSTLRLVESAKEHINFAKDKGLSVSIVYVHRPVALATYGMLTRAKKIGRAVPVAAVAESHFGAQQTIIELLKFYGDGVKFYVIDNSDNEKHKASIVGDSVSFFESEGVRYKDLGEVLNQAMEVYEAAKDNILQGVEAEALYIFEKGLEQEEESTRLEEIFNVLSQWLLKLVDGDSKVT